MKYEKRIVAFLDLLGFGNLVENSIMPNSIIDESRICELLDSAITELEREIDYCKGFKFTRFSDSFVLSFSIENGYTSIDFIFSLMQLCSTIIFDGIFVRGGISFGDVVHDKNLLFGPAMTEAYYLESKYAKFPRIILSKEVVALTCNMRDESGLVDPKFLYEKCILTDTDGYQYLDYFNFHLNGSFDAVPGLFRKFRDLIENFPSETTSIMEKKSWLVEKYNSSIQNIVDLDIKNRLDEKIRGNFGADVYLSERYDEIMNDYYISIKPIK